MDSSPPVKPDPRRALPSVDRLADRLRGGSPELAEWASLEGARRALDAARARIEAGVAVPAGDLERDAAREAERLASGHPQPVVNATGVVLHTNLGRAPLAAGALRAVEATARGYSNLEFDLDSGRRGNRLGLLADKLCLLSGAEAATACNNNAAALLLALDTLARGREVVLSRGELVEIGGSFRVPEIVERAGVRLVEVGTTNRTHPRDYERAIGPDTALLLKVHRSNFEQRGFVADVELDTLVAIGRAHGLPVVEDLGSGTLVDLVAQGFPAECYAPARLRTGADLVCFSGDKLLGGPQAGIAIGRRAVVHAMRSNPLARALRLDKLSIAALDWTLGAMLSGQAERDLPVLRQLLQPAALLERRARLLADRLSKRLASSAPALAIEISVEACRAPVGGGSLPGFELDTTAVVLRSALGAEPLAARLRAGDPPVLARVRDAAVLLDPRTLADDEMLQIEHAVERALGEGRVSGPVD